jgi:UDP-N-acetylglucosamine 2-epimerase (non-hydrolysing)
MKVAPVMNALRAHAQVEQSLVHTGQHYDQKMSKVFFEELGMPRPDVDLGIGSGPHGEQTGRMMIELEREFLDLKPDCVVVVGDVNSTLAAALVAAKLGLVCAHIEAGLRSFDRTMPEEINRIVTDRLAEILLTPSADADQNLLDEGAPADTIHRVGNVMIDTLMAHLDRAQARGMPGRLALSPGEYAVATLHRPANVDHAEVLGSLLGVLEWTQQQIPVVLPLHPRTKKRLEELSLLERARAMPNLHLTEPLGYLDFLGLTSAARFVLTDSGGLQEETTVLGIPCLTLRPNTERPVTVSTGTNTIVGSDPKVVIDAVARILRGDGKVGTLPELWDGRTSGRIAQVLVDHLS